MRGEETSVWKEKGKKGKEKAKGQVYTLDKAILHSHGRGQSPPFLFLSEDEESLPFTGGCFNFWNNLCCSAACYLITLPDLNKIFNLSYFKFFPYLLKTSDNLRGVKSFTAM